MSNTRMSLYLDEDTKKHLNILSKKYQRSQNNMINYLINKEFENTIDIDDISNKINKIKPDDIKIDRNFINEAVYGE